MFAWLIRATSPIRRFLLLFLEGTDHAHARRLDRLLTDLHQKTVSLPRPETWQPVACTKWGILDELRTFVHRKTIVMHMLEDLSSREESELTWLEERLGSYEDADWDTDDGYAPESGLAEPLAGKPDAEDAPPV